jgi:Caspase domain/Domain of unknown function (DUF4384)
MSPLLIECRSLIAVISILLSSTTPIVTGTPRPPKVESTTRSAVMTNAIETFVFQVGIDKYISPKVPKLDGCVQDVLDMKSLLIKKFNVPPNRFLTLTDRQATHDAIISGFRKQLIDNAKAHRNALVIFQYSGHGSQVKDRSGNKADGLDSTLVPVDSRDLKGSYFDIVDDEIRELFEELSQYTSNIVFIIDACHSGNPTRGAGKTRGLPEDDRPQPPEPPSRQSTRGGPQLRGGEMTAMLPRDQRYVAIAATLPHELANEKSFPEIPKANGALTFYLLKALERAKPETTYRQLMAEVANSVTSAYPSQHPQAEGDLGRPIFGGAANREDPFVEIKDVKGDLMTIKAGSAQGIAPGTIVAVYAPDAISLSGNDKKLATGILSTVEPFTSTVKLTAMSPIPLQAKVAIVCPDFGSIRTRVAIASEAVRGASRTMDVKSTLPTLLEPSRSLTLVGDVDLNAPNTRGINWDVVVKRVKFSEWFGHAATITSDRSADREVYILAGVDATRPLFDFFVELDDAEGPKKIAAALNHLANQRSLRAITNPTSNLEGGIRINLFRVTGNVVNGKLTIEKEEAINPPVDAQEYSFDQGELLRLQIENQSSADLYLTLFNISTDGSIQILYPPTGAAISLPKGAKVKPDSLIFRLGGPAGLETYKIIASTEKKGPSDYAFLQQSAVTRSSGTVSLATVSDWTTAQLNILISDKVK